MNNPTNSDELARDLGAALTDAGFTYDAVAELLGRTAHEALGRNETMPGRRHTTDGSPLATLTRLFLLQTPVAVDLAEEALPGLVDRLCAMGVLDRSVAEVAARLDCRPYSADDRDLWVVSDLTPGLDGLPNQVGAQHVLGVSSASTSLAQLTRRDPVGRALDLGTGCGIQALHLVEHADLVVATDVNTRALWMARFNAALNGVPTGPGRKRGRIETREGSFFAPVAGETFDLITSNPPFVISPGTGERLVYRDSGLPGDRVVEDIVRTAPDHLAEGGWCQILANWVLIGDQPWEERLRGWLPEATDAFVLQREVVDTASYVELWLRDAGLHGSRDYLRRYDTWLSWFDDQGVEGIGFGWINLRRRGGGTPVTRFLDWPYEVEQPIGRAIGEWAVATRAEWTEASRLVVRTDVQQETRGAPGAEDPEVIILRQQRGLRRARQADTVEAALVGACDGELTVGQILDALAELLDRDPAALRTDYLPVVSALVEEGFLAVG